MKASLLRRMIMAHGLMLAMAWVISLAIVLWGIFVKQSTWFDDDLDVVVRAMTSLIQDEEDPARVVSIVKNVRLLDMKYTKDAFLKPGEYQPECQVLDRRGRVVFDSVSPFRNPIPDHGNGIHSFGLGASTLRLRQLDAPGGRWRVLATIDESLARKLYWRNLRSSPLPLLVLFLLLALFTWGISILTLRPLRLLARDLSARQPWDLKPLSHRHEIREMKPVVRAINGLFHRIEGLLETQRRFISEVASVLQAPLARIQTASRSLESGASQRNDPSVTLQKDVDQAADLVSQLLTLARLDAMDAPATRVSLDLAELVRETIAPHIRTSLARNVDMGYEGPVVLARPVHAALVTHTVEALLIHALNRTPSGGRITVRLEPQGAGFMLSVEDTGPTLAADQRARISQGSGLPLSQTHGEPDFHLAIARKAARLQGAILVASDPGDSPGLMLSAAIGPESLP